MADNQANRAIVEAFSDASARGDRDAIAALVHDDMVMSWPQSGERFRGRDSVLGAMAAVDVEPEFAGEPRLGGSAPFPAHAARAPFLDQDT